MYTPCNRALWYSACQDCENPAFEGLYDTLLIVEKEKFIQAAQMREYIVDNVMYDFVKIDNILQLKATGNTVDVVDLLQRFAIIKAVGETPLANTTVEFDAATRRWNKTLTINLADHGAWFSRRIVDNIAKNTNGFVAVLHRKDDQKIDRMLPVFGFERGLVMTASTMDLNDAATAGCPVLTLVETGAPTHEIAIEVMAQGGEEQSDVPSAKATNDWLNMAITNAMPCYEMQHKDETM